MAYGKKPTKKSGEAYEKFKADLKAGRTEGQIVAAHLFTFFNCNFN